MATREAVERKRLEEVKRGHDILEEIRDEIQLLREVIKELVDLAKEEVDDGS